MSNEKRKIPCEVYSRVCGFFRPLSHWNKGKKEEKSERHEYTQKEILNAIDRKN